MALRFKVGDRIYVSSIGDDLPNKTVEALGLLGNEQAAITEIGYILVEGQLTSRPLPIRIYPARTTNPLFRGGRGTVIYFRSEEQINTTFSN